MLSEAEVLDEETVPQRDLIVHRREELERLLTALQPDEQGVVDLLYLLGPTGTGKTMLAKLVADLSENSEECWDGDWAHINCWQHYERRGILYQAVDQLRDAPIQPNATSQSQLINMLDERADRPQYVVLDEADQLDDKRVLYDLRESAVNVILVANNEEDLFYGIDDRLKSRLSVGRRIECPQYSATQLTAILEKRAEWVLGSPGRTYTTQQLEFIAANSDGDARVAIRALAETLGLWRASSESSIQQNHIESGIPKAREQLRQKSLGQLNDHQRTVYDVVVEQGPVKTSECHEYYSDRVDEARTERTVRTYLSKLEQYNLIDSKGPENRPRYLEKSPEIA